MNTPLPLLTPELKAAIEKHKPWDKEIADLFSVVAEKYYYHAPDDTEGAIRLWFFFLSLELDVEKLTELFNLCRVTESVVAGETKAAHGSFTMKGKEIFVDVYTDRSQLASLGKKLASKILEVHEPEGGAHGAN